MKMTRSLAAALLVALGLGAASARGAEITLYERANFGGAQLTLRGYTPNFTGTGFNDRVSSIVVTAGRWELCSDPDFKGSCAVFGPGEYPTIDRRLSDHYSSARELGSFGERRRSYDDDERGSIELYDQPGFRGRSLRLESDAEALATSGFNDRAASAVVTQGTWELCTDADYYGDCRSFPPGRYSDLGFGMERRISSARLIHPQREAPVVAAPRSARSLPISGRAYLYSERGLRGTNLAVAGAIGDLQRLGFDHEAKSILVESGNWLACRDTWFRGDCRVFGPGRYDDLAAFGFARVISSIRPAETQQQVSAAPGAPLVAPPTAVAEPSRGAVLEFYSEPGFGGERLVLERTIGDLDRMHFDRRAASVVVLGGTWELCSDARFSGSCAVYPPGRYPRMGGLTRQVVSVRRIE
jgi:hypothetical protein